MSEDWKRDAFEQLEPPAGGLTRLRARLDDADARRGNLAWVYAAASLAAGALALAMILRPAPSPAPTTGASDILVDDAGMTHAALITYGLAEAPTEPVTIPPNSRTAAYRADAQDVVFYWVARNQEGDGVDK